MLDKVMIRMCGHVVIVHVWTGDHRMVSDPTCTDNCLSCGRLQVLHRLCRWLFLEMQSCVWIICISDQGVVAVMAFLHHQRGQVPQLQLIKFHAITFLGVL